ncbi:urease accessory protein UreE [Klebsiella pneumoniae]|uniref:Urease accessory protein UreE n=1 Tax=Klebsiella pneumoniae TaxID=573 RepID=A0A377U4R2_KLEPN|nr:urease accessory protein UreE [Klebsiella pneumoniae]
MLYLTQRLEIPAAATASVTLPIDVRVKSRVKVTLNDGREAACCCPAACCCAAAMCSATKKAPSLCR